MSGTTDSPIPTSAAVSLEQFSDCSLISSTPLTQNGCTDTSTSCEALFGKFNYRDVPRLKAIFFAEFDLEKGPVMRYDVSEDGFDLDEVFDNECFQSFSSALIPRPDLMNRIVKVTIHGHRIIGFPVGLEHSLIYKREKYTFNLCFVVARDNVVDCMYEPIVQKCAEYLTDLEQLNCFLSTQENGAKLLDLMRTILTDLNEKGEVIHTLNYVHEDVSTMYLKMCPAYRGVDPPVVTLYMVPLWIRKVELTRTVINKMDILSQKIIPCIDGVRCVKEIAIMVDLDPDLVARCVRNLHFYECVTLVPVFLYTNTYVATERLHEVYHDQPFINWCLDFIRLREKEKNGKIKEYPRPLFRDVFRLYISLKCGKQFIDWCRENNPRSYNVDERRFIQFGIFNNFLRKLSIYPVFLHAEGENKVPVKPVVYDFSMMMTEDDVNRHMDIVYRSAESSTDLMYVGTKNRKSCFKPISYSPARSHPLSWKTSSWRRNEEMSLDPVSRARRTLWLQFQEARRDKLRHLSDDIREWELISSLCDGTRALEDLAVIYSTGPNYLYERMRKLDEFDFIAK